MRLRDSGVSVRYLDREAVILDLDTSKYLTVNATGAVILRALALGAETTEMVAAVIERFDIDRSTAESDVRAFLESLQELGLIDDG
jgi:hypothetical protein